MKATLEYNLPEEAAEHLAAIHGAEWRNLVHELDQQLRSWVKYGTATGDPVSVSGVRDYLRELLRDSNLSLD